MLLWWVANTDLLSWEKLSGLSGAAVLAAAVVGFLTGKIVAGYLYREIVEDRNRWAARADDATALARKSIETMEALTERLVRIEQAIQDATKHRGA